MHINLVGPHHSHKKKEKKEFAQQKEEYM